MNSILVTRSETELDTWMNAVSDCNKKNVYLESNETIIKNYITTHDDVNSLWVGRFDALLPWIEIRGELFCIIFFDFISSIISEFWLGKISVLKKMRFFLLFFAKIAVSFFLQIIQFQVFCYIYQVYVVRTLFQRSNPKTCRPICKQNQLLD